MEMTLLIELILWPLAAALIEENLPGWRVFSSVAEASTRERRLLEML